MISKALSTTKKIGSKKMNKNPLFIFPILMFLSCACGTTQSYYHPQAKDGVYLKGKPGIKLTFGKKNKQGNLHVESLGLKTSDSNNQEKWIALRLTIEHQNSAPILIEPAKQSISYQLKDKIQTTVGQDPSRSSDPIVIPPGYARIIELAFMIDPNHLTESQLEAFSAHFKLNCGQQNFNYTVQFQKKIVNQTQRDFNILHRMNSTTTHYGQTIGTIFY